MSQSGSHNNQPYSAPIATDAFEPMIEDGVQLGEVHWLTQQSVGGTTVLSGIWTIGPEVEPMPYAVGGAEILEVIEGQLDIVDSTGATHSFTSGTAVAFPDGFDGRWHFVKPSRLLFVMVIPAA